MMQSQKLLYRCIVIITTEKYFFTIAIRKEHSLIQWQCIEQMRDASRLLTERRDFDDTDKRSTNVEANEPSCVEQIF